MKKSTLFTLLLSLNASLISASEYSGDISLSFGDKDISSNDWEGDESLNSIGIIANIKQSNWPVSIAFDAFLSLSEDLSEDNDEVSSSEYHLGLRKVWQIPYLSLSPYLGGGFAVAFASLDEEIEGDKENDTDRSIGVWAGIGANWNVIDNITIGADIRYSDAEYKLHNKDFDATGMSSAISVGYIW